MANTRTIFQILLIHCLLTQVCMDVHTYLKDINEIDGSTKCSEMFLINDKIVVYGNATFSNNSTKDAGGKFTLLYGETETELKRFLYSTFKNCEKLDTNKTFSCVFNESFALTQLYVSASTDLSGLFLQLQVNSAGKQPYHSNKVKIPKIVDPSNIIMTFNGTTKKHGLIELNKTKENRRHEICCNEAPKPCYAVISSSEQVLTRSIQCATYSLKESETEFNIGVEVCGVYKSNLYTLKLPNEQNIIVIVISCLAAIVAIILVGLLVTYCIKKRKCCNKANQVKRQHSESIPMNDLQNTKE